MVSAHFTIKHHTVEFTHFWSIYCKIIQNHLKIQIVSVDEWNHRIRLVCLPFSSFALCERCWLPVGACMT